VVKKGVLVNLDLQNWTVVSGCGQKTGHGNIGFSIGGSIAWYYQDSAHLEFIKGLLSYLQREFRNDSLYILECDCFDDDKGAPIFNLEKPGEARFWCFVQKDGIRSVVTEGDKCFHLL